MCEGDGPVGSTEVSLALPFVKDGNDGLLHGGRQLVTRYSFMGPRGQRHTPAGSEAAHRGRRTHTVFTGGWTHTRGPRATRRSLGGSGANTSARPGSTGGAGAKVSSAPSAAELRAPPLPALPPRFPGRVALSCAPHSPAPRLRGAEAPPRMPRTRRNRIRPRTPEEPRARSSGTARPHRIVLSSPRPPPPAERPAHARALVRVRDPSYSGYGEHANPVTQLRAQQVLDSCVRLRQ